ncbi:M56 family metallopeptidase [Hungatella hathewayi]|uniref:M56 family metallopeptidase n=2 Tax=Hungatella hathewayi TaxID=154046 RepID=UPI0011DD0BFB|nr:M56 family metallopeptidase [Hungatella hathewayi]
MTEILKTMLSLSLSGSLLILLLFLLRPVIKARLSKRWQYYIWLVVAARLMLPFAPEENFMGTFFQGIDRPSRRQSWRLQPDSRPPWPVFLQRNTKLTDPKSCITNKENP